MAIGVGSLISGGLGLLSGAFSGIGAKKRQEQALQWQSQENAQNRAYNKKMAEWANAMSEKHTAQQNAWNEKMTDLAYSRSLPSTRMAQLKGAGLNPGLAMGNSASFSSPATTTSSAASTFAPSPSDPVQGAGIIAGTPSMGESMLRGIDAMRTVAETQNIQADTAKKKDEEISINLDNIEKAATQGNRIEASGLSVSLSKQALQLGKQELSNLSQALSNLQKQNELLNSTIDQTNAQTRNLDSQSYLNRINASLRKPEFDLLCKRFAQEVKQSDANISLTQAEAKKILVTMIAEKMNIEADTLLKQANVGNVKSQTTNNFLQSNILKIQGRQMTFDYQQSTKYDDALKAAQIGGSGTSFVGEFMKGVAAGTFMRNNK